MQDKENARPYSTVGQIPRRYWVCVCKREAGGGGGGVKVLAERPEMDGPCWLLKLETEVNAQGADPSPFLYT